MLIRKYRIEVEREWEKEGVKIRGSEIDMIGREERHINFLCNVSSYFSGAGAEKITLFHLF